MLIMWNVVQQCLLPTTRDCKKYYDEYKRVRSKFLGTNCLPKFTGRQPWQLSQAAFRSCAFQAEEGKFDSDIFYFLSRVTATCISFDRKKVKCAFKVHLFFKNSWGRAPLQLAPVGMVNCAFCHSLFSKLAFSTVDRYSLYEGKKLFVMSLFAGGWVHSVAFSGDGNRICWVAHNSSINIADASNGNISVTSLKTQFLPFNNCMWVRPDSILVAVSTLSFFRSVFQIDSLPKDSIIRHIYLRTVLTHPSIFYTVEPVYNKLPLNEVLDIMKKFSFF